MALTRAELGLRLQTVRGALWQEALAGDDYAELLCDYVDPSARRPLPTFTAPVRRSALSAWIVTEPALAATVLTHRDFGYLRTDGQKAHLQILPMTEAGLTPTPAERERVEAELAAPAAFRQSWPRALVEHAGPLAEKVAGRASFDLVGDYAVPLATAALTTVLGQTDTGTVAAPAAALGCAADALVTPQPLADVLALLAALRVLRSGWGAHPPLPLAVLYLATAPTAVAGALRRQRETGTVDGWYRQRPPLRLLARVAQRDVELGGQQVRENDQVVVLVQADSAAVDTVSAADPWSGSLRWLLEETVTVAAETLTTRIPGLDLTSEPVRRPRSPVTHRFACWEVAPR